MKKDFTHILKEAGLKVTPSRLAILAAFSIPCRPLNAEEISRKIGGKRGMRATNPVTVYRTLQSFSQAGILKKINLQKDSVHYELADHHHHHVVCTGCGTIEEFNTCDIDTISRNVLKRSRKFKTIKEHSLELFGTCRSCATI